MFWACILNPAILIPNIRLVAGLKLPTVTSVSTIWPVIRRAVAFWGIACDDALQSYRPYPPDLSSGAGGKTPLPNHLGCRRRSRARTDHRDGIAPPGAQCHRQPRWLLCGLSRARGFVWRTRPDPPSRPHEYPSRRDHWAVSTMD